MQTLKFLFLLYLCATANACRDNAEQRAAGWIAQIGGRDAEIAFDVVETTDRRVCATGIFSNSARFGAGKTAPRLEAGAFQDIFVACYTPDGELAWMRQLGTGRGDEPRALAALPGGDILVTGYFAHSLGVGADTPLQAENGNADAFLVRLDAAGNPVWARKYGGTLADLGSAVAVTDDGGILLAGSFQETLFFDADGKRGKLNSAGSRDAFVLKLDSDGQVLWAKRFGGPGSDEATAVAAGRNGQVLLAGTFQADVDSDGGAEPLSALGSSDAFLLAFSADGRTLWSRQVAGRQREIVSGLATDSRGGIFLAGTFQNELELPGGGKLESAGSTDVFVVRFDPDGHVQGSFSFGGTQIEQLNGVAVTNDGTLLLTGLFQGELDVAPDAKGRRLQAPGPSNSDGFVLALDADGHYRAAGHLSGTGVEMGMGIVALADGGLGLTGVFGDDLVLEVPGAERLDSHGKTDAFVARIDLPAR